MLKRISLFVFFAVILIGSVGCATAGNQYGDSSAQAVAREDLIMVNQLGLGADKYILFFERHPSMVIWAYTTTVNIDPSLKKPVVRVWDKKHYTIGDNEYDLYRKTVITFQSKEQIKEYWFIPTNPTLFDK